MELHNNEAAVRSDSADSQAGAVSAGEIDLYDELRAFEELSPEEQLRSLGGAVSQSAETEISTEVEVQETAFNGSVLTQ